MNFPYGESDFRLWDRIKLGLEPRPCVSLSKRLREASSNKSAAESFNTRKGECFGPATGHARALRVGIFASPACARARRRAVAWARISALPLTIFANFRKGMGSSRPQFCCLTRNKGGGQHVLRIKYGIPKVLREKPQTSTF